MQKYYNIFLNNILIGTTTFEAADVPMGVVVGTIIFENIASGYDFFKAHCEEHGVVINTDYPEDNFLDTQVIPELKVFSESNTEIQGFGAFVTGFDAEGFELTVGGIDASFYKVEFKKHYDTYWDVQ